MVTHGGPGPASGPDAAQRNECYRQPVRQKVGCGPRCASGSGARLWPVPVSACGGFRAPGNGAGQAGSAGDRPGERMEFVGLIVLVIIKILPARVAMPVIAGVLFLLSVGAFAWHSALQTTVTYCNSAQGRFSQLFNGSQTANCGLD